MNLLEIKNLSVDYITNNGRLRAVDQVHLEIQQGQILGLVGESGCGKSALALACLRLNRAKVTGQICFQGQDLLGLSQNELRSLRGKKIAMIFQESLGALSPVHSVEVHLRETLSLHCPDLSKSELKSKALEYLKQVGLPTSPEFLGSYLHQLSGGQQQRLLIALSISGNPDLIIADEPTTSLDVTIQNQILELLVDLAKQNNRGLLFISHNLNLVSQICDQVAIMYAGQIIERGQTQQIFSNPQHPYTRALVLLGMQMENHRRDKALPSIQGSVPSSENWKKACRFKDRCQHAQEICGIESPQLKPAGPQAEAQVACHFPLPKLQLPLASE